MGIGNWEIILSIIIIKIPIPVSRFLIPNPIGNKIAAMLKRNIMEKQGKEGRIREMGKQGYEKLIVWQNAYKLRRLIYETSKKLPKSEFRRSSHIQETARSVKQNIQEGYLRPTINDYIRFLVISRSSLGELIGDIQDCFDDKLITMEEFQKLDSLAGRTDYLLMRLIQSLYQKKKKGTWKTFAKTYPPDFP